MEGMIESVFALYVETKYIHIIVLYSCVDIICVTYTKTKMKLK